MSNIHTGVLFDSQLQNEIKDKFYQVDQDHLGRKRLFFENSGGSLRLKSAVEAKERFEKIPDCPDRNNETSKLLQKVKEEGIRDIIQIIFGAKSGALVTELTASQVMFQITQAIVENVPGTNVVTTSIEHPSAYDSAKYYADKTGKEFRVAMANPKTGGVDTEEIIKLIDENTCLLSVISASNISGNVLNIEEIVTEARKIKPDLYIISDAVQHVPHGVIDVDKLQLDGVNFAPYKGFGVRGCGYGYISDRVAKLPHHKLLAKPENEWELGSFPASNFAAISAVVDYVCWIGEQFIDSDDRRTLYVEGMNRIHLHERALLHHLLEGTKDIPGLRYINGVNVLLDSENLQDRDLISAISIDGIGFTHAVEQYYKRGVTVFERVNTSIYSKRIVESLGLVGAIRVSPLHCHDTKDIDEFLKITSQLVEEITKHSVNV
ncbi:aminotransferase class V-fold PLP-dependent enzyme [Ureibacillus manganicus]|uniref:Aminotransferase n=1 Tax=Ureibacillus manganicus DSM 26584 TaxID=1384049 RepID=A0A0A3I0U8_9BACL|nr:aminotransferase class V-fold PLP-dependent enzyme [Ureibacillus manganicus]KGR77130.1 aminotransferase [Ureibacillus manganicus DSM 26584]